MKNFGTSLLAMWRELGLNQKASLIVAAVAVVAGLIAVSIWSHRPDYQLLYGKLSEKDSAAVISYLETANIPHQVSAGGTTVMVPSDQVYKIRMDLAGKGIPSGDGVGFEIFDKGQFGLSDFVQRTNYLRAVQGELARTISQLQGVHAARVMIVQPENRLLLTEQGVKSTASVFVDVGGGRLEIDQVNSIRHLVANSVQGLAVDDVSVVDNHGRTLSEDLKTDPSLGTASSQMKYRQQVEDYLSKKVESMLSQVIGPGNAVVRVSAEIDTEATTLTEEKYDPEGQVVRSQTQTEEKANSVESRSGGGAVGVSANVPDKAAVAAQANGNATHPSSTTDSDHTSRTTTYEINRTLTNITRAPGSVKNVTAAVLIAPKAAAPGAQPVKRTAEELNALRQVVINALGLKVAQGQSLDSLVTLNEMAFVAETIPPEVTEAAKEGKLSGIMEMASRWGALVLAVGLFLVFLRMLGKQKPEALPVEVLTLPPDLAARARPNPNTVTADMLNELIRAKPANVGTALKEWIATQKS